MALQFTYCKIGKGIDIDGSEFYNFYGKDFNPNVPSVPTWTTTGVYDETSTFNLVGFQPGHEVGCCVVIINNNGDSSRTQHIYADFYQGSSRTWTYDAGNVTVGAGSEWMLYAYFGVDYDEIWSGYSNYRVEWQMLDDSIDASFSVSGLSIDSTRHSSGYLWIEGNYLCYTDATYSSNRGYKHKINYDTGYSGGSGDAGYVWIPSGTTGRIYYTDAYGVVRRTHLADQWYGSRRYGTSGYIYVSDGDTQDGYGYLCFVDGNGELRRLGNGVP